jgi:hypothetical protein
MTDKTLPSFLNVRPMKHFQSLLSSATQSSYCIAHRSCISSNHTFDSHSPTNTRSVYVLLVTPPLPKTNPKGGNNNVCHNVAKPSVSQSVRLSWCRAPFGAHDQIFDSVWLLLYRPWGRLLSREDGLSFVRVIVSSNISVVRMHNIFIFTCHTWYYILYKDSVNPGSV